MAGRHRTAVKPTRLLSVSPSPLASRKAKPFLLTIKTATSPAKITFDPEVQVRNPSNYYTALWHKAFPNAVFLPAKNAQTHYPTAYAIPRKWQPEDIPHLPQEILRYNQAEAWKEAYRQHLSTISTSEEKHAQYRFSQAMKNPNKQKFYIQLDDSSPLQPTYTNTPLCPTCGYYHANPNPKKPTRCYYPELEKMRHSLVASLEKSRTKLTETQANSSHLTVATDCSGIEAPIQALRNMGINYQHLFSSDNDPMVRSTIYANRHLMPTTYYGDLTLRDPKFMPTADIYIAGFPCQSFSTAGKQQGFSDDKGRGTIFHYIFEYLSANKPKVFVLENVQGLTTIDEGACLQHILTSLHSITSTSTNKSHYNISHKILNTREHGIPHNRPRWYCVGIAKEAMRSDHAFKFPSPIPCPNIDEILDDFGEKPDGDSYKSLSPTAQRNVTNATARIIKRGHNPQQHSYVVDCDASSARSREILNYTPCITRSRHRGHWLTKQNRRMTIHEMFRLQGMDHSTFHRTGTSKNMGEQIGNSMSVNVLERLFYQIFQSVNFSKALTTTKTPIQDSWQNGTAITRLCSSKGKHFKSENPHQETQPKIPLRDAGKHVVIQPGSGIELDTQRGIELCRLEREHARAAPCGYTLLDRLHCL